jgi:hypothetical protein
MDKMALKGHTQLKRKKSERQIDLNNVLYFGFFARKQFKPFVQRR